MFLWNFLFRFKLKLKNKELVEPEPVYDLFYFDILNDPDILDSAIGVGSTMKIAIPMRFFYQLLQSHSKYDRYFSDFVKNKAVYQNYDVTVIEKQELLQLIIIFANRYADLEGVIDCGMDEICSSIAVNYSNSATKIHSYKLIVRELISSCGHFSYVKTENGIRLKLNRNKIKTVPPVTPDDDENLPTSPPPVVDDRTSTP